jgi:hypothetical protein
LFCSVSHFFIATCFSSVFICLFFLCFFYILFDCFLLLFIYLFVQVFPQQFSPLFLNYLWFCYFCLWFLNMYIYCASCFSQSTMPSAILTWHFWNSINTNLKSR